MTETPPALTAAQTAPRVHPAAVWSLILGILSLFCLWLLGAIPAIILGVIAMKKIAESPDTLTGRGMAISGIVTGSVGILVGTFFVAIYASVALPAFSGAQSRAIEAQQMNNGRMTAIAIFAYAADNDGKFPANLEDLVPDYIDTADVLQFTDPATDETMPFLYRSDAAFEDGPDEPLLMAPRPIGDRRIVIYSDGRGERVPEPLDEELSGAFDAY